MGVFATRSPFRPNPIGLSSVKIESIELNTPNGPVITVTGADLMDGTPIYDIKPYITISDCHTDASDGFAKYTAKEDPILLTIIQLSITAILGWIAAPIYDGTFDFKIVSQWNVLNSILYLGLFSTMLGFLLQNVCQKIVRPSTTSLILSFEAVFGVLSSVIFLHEKITLRMFIGCILIFTALLISETNFFKAKKEISD